jgi:hypothetical protein
MDDEYIFFDDVIVLLLLLLLLCDFALVEAEKKRNVNCGKKTFTRKNNNYKCLNFVNDDTI